MIRKTLITTGAIGFVAGVFIPGAIGLTIMLVCAALVAICLSPDDITPP